MAEKYRKEHDSMGEVLVPEDKYWGAQTQRSLENFKIGEEKMPMEMIRALAILKSAAAKTNNELLPQKMSNEKCKAIQKACREICDGELCGNFPLAVWQTGSGTQYHHGWLCDTLPHRCAYHSLAPIPP